MNLGSMIDNVYVVCTIGKYLFSPVFYIICYLYVVCVLLVTYFLFPIISCNLYVLCLILVISFFDEHYLYV